MVKASVEFVQIGSYFSPLVWVGIGALVVFVILGLFFLHLAEQSSESLKGLNEPDKGDKHSFAGKDVKDDLVKTLGKKINVFNGISAFFLILAVLLVFAAVGRGFSRTDSGEVQTKEALAQAYDMQFTKDTSLRDIIPFKDSYSVLPEATIGNQLYVNVRISRKGDFLSVWVPEESDPSQLREILPVG